jgi:hypothetical protein
MLWKATLASVLAGGFLLLGGATTVRADDYDSCHRNVDKWEDKLERDIHRYGHYSRQANHDRHELGEARESCERRRNYDRRDHYDYDHDGDRR